MENWLESSIDGIVIPSYLPPLKKKIINFQGMVSWVSLKNLRVSLRFPKLRGLICFTRRLWTHTRRAGCNCHLAQWYYRGTFCGQLLSWWFRNSADKLRLVVYPIIYDGFYASQVVGNGISEPPTVSGAWCTTSDTSKHREGRLEIHVPWKHLLNIWVISRYFLKIPQEEFSFWCRRLPAPPNVSSEKGCFSGWTWREFSKLDLSTSKHAGWWGNWLLKTIQPHFLTSVILCGEMQLMET